jgi:hypothetical protein
MKKLMQVEPITLEWLTFAGLAVFATWISGLQGVWQLLLRSDPTGLTMVIMTIFVGSSLWCGARARELSRQRRYLTQPLVKFKNEADEEHKSWVHEYWDMLEKNPRDSGSPLDLLLEHTHGSHSTAWWVNGIQLKLGLLGKVIGFSILALQIGKTQSFDASQSQDLLRSLTSGLGVALLTTMVGLVGNILLGLQLTRLDRFADLIVTQAQRIGMQK